MDIVKVEITESYQKARRIYAGFSGLLLGWEFIGIQFLEAGVSSLKFGIKNPEAIPYVILILVIYFSYRLTNEWTILDKSSKASKSVKIDFLVSHLLGLLSIIIFVYQQLSGIQVFQIIQENLLLIFIIGMAFGAGLMAYLTFDFIDLSEFKKRKGKALLFYYYGIIVRLSLVILPFSLTFPFKDATSIGNFKYVVVITLSAITGYSIIYIVNRFLYLYTWVIDNFSS